jgi:aspartyl-tRNA synthetase
MNWKIRRYTDSLSLSDKGASIELSGWIDTIRDHGQLLFAHLRDVTGVVQLVFDPTVNKTCYQIGESLRNEFTVTLTGTVLERDDSAKNPHLPNGNIEIQVDTITVHSTALTPPFVLTEKSLVDDTDSEFNVDEDLRLTYRYLDLRRPSMQHKLKMRSKIFKTIRDFFDEAGFYDIETPVLTKSTPEGARDYLVPSRVHHAHFYALPQSPQLFKQLLMCSGFDKYYQIVKCFRDEDLRPNRQPEFTQLDLEASFIDESFIFELMESLMERVFGLVNQSITGPFPHITYHDAISRYGTDRPDLRFGMELVNITPLLIETNYKIFNTIANKKGLIKGIKVVNHADKMSKSFLQEELAKKVVPSFGGKGMSWMKVSGGKLESNIVQFFSESEQQSLITAFEASEGDVLLLVADTNHHLVHDVLGRLRLYVAEKFNLIPKESISPCWVTQFPLFEEREGKLISIHHPFTAPDQDITTMTTHSELLTVNSRGYDLVINGEEIGGGSIRIHDSAIQEKIFECLGLSKDDIEEKFGWFVEALQYGTPPHGGLALGLDRLTAMILGTSSIREVIAFPKNRTASCPLTNAPSPVSDDQLDELGIAVKTPVTEESVLSPKI